MQIQLPVSTEDAKRINLQIYDRMELMLALERMLEYQVKETVNDGYHYHRLAATQHAENILKAIKERTYDCDQKS